MRNHFLFNLIIFSATVVTVAILLNGCSRFSGLSGGGEELAQSPITDHPSGRRFPGRFIWHDLLTPDLDLAGGFYEKLFGWQIEYLEHAAIVRHNGKRIAGIIEVQPTDSRAHGLWIPSISVESVDSAVTLAQASEGQLLKGPLEMKGRGRAALIKDFQGAEMVLLTAKGGDPIESEAALGDWLWDEVWTNDPEKTKIFYQSVLGYDEIVSANEGYDVFLREGEWMAGMRQLERARQDLLWVPIVRVSDPAAMAEQVEALGGMVLLSPDEAPGNGNVSLISDPTGTILLIQRWPSL